MLTTKNALIDESEQLPSIFLFCNHGFGLPFSLRAIRMLSHKRRLVLVYYVTRYSWKQLLHPGRLYLALWYFALKSYVDLLCKLKGARSVCVHDVNSAEFLDTVPPHSHGIVCGFGQIFKRRAIDSFQSLVNFHPSILPYYRGPVPSRWVLKNGERQTGYTLHRISERIDAGEILFQESVECDGMQSENALNRKIALAAQSTFARYLTHLLSGSTWTKVTLDARSVYRVLLDYGTRF